MKRLPRDVQAKIQQKYKNIPPEKQKELEFKSRVRRFMASTEMDANVLEGIKKQIEINENQDGELSQPETRNLPIYDADRIAPNDYREPHQKPKKIAYKASKPTYWDQIERKRKYQEVKREIYSAVGITQNCENEQFKSIIQQ